MDYVTGSLPLQKIFCDLDMTANSGYIRRRPRAHVTHDKRSFVTAKKPSQKVKLGQKKKLVGVAVTNP